MRTKTHKLSWNKIDSIHRRLIFDITKEGFIPDVLFGIMRGGLVPLAHMAYLLDIKDSRVMYVSRYTHGKPEDHCTSEPRIINITNDLLSIEGKNILLIDSAIGTGKTIMMAYQELKVNNPTNIKVAITADWSGSPTRPPNNFFEEYSVHIGSRFQSWPIFPWEE